VAGDVERGSFPGLHIIQALATDGNALVAEDGGDAGLGDAVAIADPLGGFARFVAVHDVGDILKTQEAL
jgi:hypothetical protein